MMQREKILITVKTYPTLSLTYGELACTAGIREDGSWVRIYPVPFRRLKEDYQFEKYAWIELPLAKNTKDPRPESFRPLDLSQIVRTGWVGTADSWQERRQLILKNVPCYTDMAELIAGAKANAVSLALFKPTQIDDFIHEETEREWSVKKLNAVLADLKQGMLFPADEFIDDFKIAKRLPYKFSYVFRDSCGRQSTMMIKDWEVGALYWNCMKKYDSEEQALKKVREMFFQTFQEKRELYFYLGTTLQWHFVGPNPFVIVGTFAPPIEKQLYMNFQEMRDS